MQPSFGRGIRAPCDVSIYVCGDHLTATDCQDLAIHISTTKRRKTGSFYKHRARLLYRHAHTLLPATPTKRKQPSRRTNGGVHCECTNKTTIAKKLKTSPTTRGVRRTVQYIVIHVHCSNCSPCYTYAAYKQYF